MAKLLCLQGLPASGKSTKCAELLKEYGNAVRVNRDLLRTMLHCDVWSMGKEGVTRDVATGVVRDLLREGKVGVVIIDETNLIPATVSRWKQLAQEHEAVFEVVTMETPLEECLLRDASRKESVGRSVIIGMALQAGLYPKPTLGVVLCDIDGTLADCTQRLGYLQETPKNWKAFFDAVPDDTPRRDVIQMVMGYQVKGYEIFLVSGRPDDCRKQTEEWLIRHATDLHYKALFMRRAADHRPDTVVKEEILSRYFPDTTWIHCAIDDRPSILRVWGSHGIRTIDVGKGEEF